VSDHLDAALHFEGLAEHEHRSEERDRLLATARAFRWLAIAEGRRYVREMRKRPRASSVKRNADRKRA
jgi:hypothetical protein